MDQVVNTQHMVDLWTEEKKCIYRDFGINKGVKVTNFNTFNPGNLM